MALAPGGASDPEAAEAGPEARVSYIDASLAPYNVSPSVADNASGLLGALAAAAGGGPRVVKLPPGTIGHSKDLTLPAGFQGPIVVEGAADTVTQLQPLGGCNGFNFDLSAGVPDNNTAEIRDIGFLAPAAAGFPIKISYGTKGLGSVGSVPGSKIRDVVISGGGWAQGIILQECWNFSGRCIKAFGVQSNYITKGPALTLMSGVNNRFSDLQFNFWGQGVILNADDRGAGGDCQGIKFSQLDMMECVEGVHAYGTPGGNLGTLFFTDWMCDNGNLLVPGHRSFVIENGTDVKIGQGQGLQDGGDSQIIFDTCKNCTIARGVSLEFRANVTGPVVQDNNGTGNDLGGQPVGLVNLSTRGPVGTGSNVMIAGFVIGGQGEREVLIRASGPSLSLFGLSGVLPDPILTLLSGSTVLATNQGWRGASDIATAAAQVGAFPWSPGSLDSAILTTLAPGNYTAQVSGASGDTGTALVEVYEVG